LHPVAPAGTRDAVPAIVIWSEKYQTTPASRAKNQSLNMPVISKFYGIVIRMLFIRRFVAHFHAFYGDQELIVGINPPRILQGCAPARASGMVLEWAGEHQSELLEAWHRCSAAQPPTPIAPLP
jgi:hypothetical protein